MKTFFSALFKVKLYSKPKVLLCSFNKIENLQLGKNNMSEFEFEKDYTFIFSSKNFKKRHKV